MPQPLVVIVVDDEPDLRAMLVEILEDEGFDVLSFSDPQQLLTWKSVLQPSLFLLDLMLPGMSGIELAERLKSSHYGDARRIALSASPTMLRHAADSNLFDGTLPKPFEIDDLIRTLHHLAA